MTDDFIGYVDDRPGVTQADRELYLALGVAHVCEDRMILAGWADNSPEMLAIVAHRLAAVPKWRPIDTAPRDGTIVLLTTGTHTGTGRWRHVASLDTLNDVGGIAVFAREYGWHSVSDKNLNKTPPTHWQPLPDPPVSHG